MSSCTSLEVGRIPNILYSPVQPLANFGSVLWWMIASPPTWQIWEKNPATRCKLQFLKTRENEKNKNKQGKSIVSVSHYGLAIYIKKYFKAKDELWKFKYFIMQKYNLQKNPLEATKILQDIITL